jgi:hypothetical protein
MAVTEDQLAVLLVPEVRAVVEGDLRLVVAEGLQMLLRDAEPLFRERNNRASSFACWAISMLLSGAVLPLDGGMVVFPRHQNSCVGCLEGRQLVILWRPGSTI